MLNGSEIDEVSCFLHSPHVYIKPHHRHSFLEVSLRHRTGFRPQSEGAPDWLRSHKHLAVDDYAVLHPDVNQCGV